MLLTRYNHACVRLEKDGRSLVVDPGSYTEPEALQDATAVLVTHEHADHVDPDLLVAAQTGNPDLAVHTHPDVVALLAGKGVAARPVSVGDSLRVAGFDVRVVGGRHAEIYDGLPGCANLGFVVDGRVYHPGDSVFVPDGDVEVLLVPASGPWLKLREAIDFVRAVRPSRAFPIHDAVLTDAGKALADGWLAGKGAGEGVDYSRLVSGESVELG